MLNGNYSLPHHKSAKSNYLIKKRYLSSDTHHLRTINKFYYVLQSSGFNPSLVCTYAKRRDTVVVIPNCFTATGGVRFYYRME